MEGIACLAIALGHHVGTHILTVGPAVSCFGYQTAIRYRLLSCSFSKFVENGDSENGKRSRQPKRGSGASPRPIILHRPNLRILSILIRVLWICIDAVSAHLGKYAMTMLGHRSAEDSTSTFGRRRSCNVWLKLVELLSELA